jgi:hypothetical protein
MDILARLGEWHFHQVGDCSEGANPVDALAATTARALIDGQVSSGEPFGPGDNLVRRAHKLIETAILIEVGKLYQKQVEQARVLGLSPSGICEKKARADIK